MLNNYRYSIDKNPSLFLYFSEKLQYYNYNFDSKKIIQLYNCPIQRLFKAAVRPTRSIARIESN